MQILMQTAIGDLLATAIANPSLDRNDPMPLHYKVLFVDVATEKSAWINFPTECEAIDAVLAHTMADDCPPRLQEMLRHLQAMLPVDFLP